MHFHFLKNSHNSLFLFLRTGHDIPDRHFEAVRIPVIEDRGFFDGFCHNLSFKSYLSPECCKYMIFFKTMQQISKFLISTRLCLFSHHPPHLLYLIGEAVSLFCLTGFRRLSPVWVAECRLGTLKVPFLRRRNVNPAYNNSHTSGRSVRCQKE